MLDVRRLAVLRAVSREGSMAGAAAAMAFTPSAVSQQIAALERQTGTPLVVRGPRGVRLTEAGQLLVGHTDAVVDRLERAETELADLVSLRAGRLRMATFPSAGARLLPDAIGIFGREFPDVRMSLEIVPEAADCPPMVRDGTLDLAVVLAFRPNHGFDEVDLDGMRAEHLLDDTMFVALPADHPLAAADPHTVDMADLHHERWIRDDGGSQCSALLVRMCGAAGYEPQVAFDSGDYGAVGRLVASGVGVALVPGLAADQMVEGVVLRAARPAQVREVSALVPAVPSPAAEAMLEVLVAASGAVGSGAGPAGGVRAGGVRAGGVSAGGVSAGGVSARAVRAGAGGIAAGVRVDAGASDAGPSMVGNGRGRQRQAVHEAEPQTAVHAASPAEPSPRPA